MRRPNSIEKDASVRQELDGAWSLFNAWCIGNNLSASLVTSRPVFTDWYLALREGKGLTQSPLCNGWRGEISSQFSTMIGGNNELTFTYNKSIQAQSSPL